MDNRKTKQLSRPNLMPRRVYRFRVIGMALGGIPNAVVMNELNVPIASWAWLIFTCYLWPHLAYILAIKSKKPFIVERNNLLIDSFIAGSWASLLHFNLLPAVLLIAITLADKISSGIKKLWLYSLPIIITGTLLMGLFTGFAFHPNTSTAVILACLPILIIHTFLVALGSYNLIRKVQLQNLRYKELSQKDTLTPLLNRRAWQEKVNDLIIECRNKKCVASIVLFDIDDFKSINDKHGHSIGDDVILAIATILADTSGENAVVGRIGGDEFAVVIPHNKSQAKQIAQSISQQIKDYVFASEKDLLCTMSFGVSETSSTNNDFRQWFDAADKALYKAKVHR